jgi:hypothetical protein
MLVQTGGLVIECPSGPPMRRAVGQREGTAAGDVWVLDRVRD